MALATSTNIAGGDVATTWQTAASEEVRAAGPARLAGIPSSRRREFGGGFSRPFAHDRVDDA